MAKEPERLEIDIPKIFFYSPYFYAGKSHIVFNDAGHFYHVFRSYHLYGDLSGQGYHHLCSSGFFYLLGLDGAFAKSVQEAGIFQGFRQ